MKTYKLLVIFLGTLLFSASCIHCDNDDEGTHDEEPTQDDAEDENDVDIEEDNNVLVLTEKNFDVAVNSHEVILVEFYAPWCGHCKTLAPEYEKAAATLKEADPPVALAKVDATVESSLGTRYDVGGYPTLKFFKNGQVNDYDGPRTEAGIVEFMKEKSDPNWQPPPSEVLVLTSSNFTAFVNNEELSLVEFYAPWCGHCKRLAPEYDEAASILKVQGIRLAKVDATQDPDLAKEYDVTGYPTLTLFRSGKSYEYKGERNKASDFVQYMSSQKGSATKEKDSLKDVQKQLNKDDITVVGFFESAEDEAYSIYDEFTNSVRDEYTMLHTFDKAARDHYKVNAGSLVVFNAERFHTKHENKWHVKEIEPESLAYALLQFVQEHEVPLVGHMSSVTKTKRYLKKGRKDLVIFFYDVDWSFDTKVATEQKRQKAVRIAKDNPGLTFVVADEKETSDLFKEFGFDDSGEDLNIGILSSNEHKFPLEPMEDGYDEDSVRDFIQQFLIGGLKPKIKSQKPPKKQGVVATVVGHTFDKIVMDKDKNVLIEFYAPWCGHCQKLEPKYKEFAKKNKNNKKLVVAKFDATANDYPKEFEVEGFPTIFYVSDQNVITKYTGSKDVKGFTAFITEQTEAEDVKYKKYEL